MDGADLDPNEPLFEGALKHLAETCFNSDDAYELMRSQGVESNVYNFMNLTGAPQRIKKLEKKQFTTYPKIAHDIADHWDGNPVLKLDEEYCQRRAENAAPCTATLTDPRVLNPKTVSRKKISILMTFFRCNFNLDARRMNNTNTLIVINV